MEPRYLGCYVKENRAGSCTDKVQDKVLDEVEKQNGRLDKVDDKVFDEVQKQNGRLVSASRPGFLCG
jgi:hypothetical protein